MTVTRHTSHGTRHTSHGTRHTSPITRLTSHVTRQLVEEFKKKFKIDCTTEEKAMFRLRTAAAKTRESVSGVPKVQPLILQP